MPNYNNGVYSTCQEFLVLPLHVSYLITLGFITSGVYGVLHIQVSAGDGGVLYGRRRRCLVWPETVMSRMAGDGDVSYGWR